MPNPRGVRKHSKVAGKMFSAQKRAGSCPLFLRPRKDCENFLFNRSLPPVSGNERFRKGDRISTAHVESTVNQSINWRFCKKQQMSWTRAGAQGLFHVRAR